MLIDLIHEREFLIIEFLLMALFAAFELACLEVGAFEVVEEFLVGEGEEIGEQVAFGGEDGEDVDDLHFPEAGDELSEGVHAA
jgi:hypothetical protein